MSRLPEKGDVEAAIRRFDARMNAASNDESIYHTGAISARRGGGLDGPGAQAMLRVYGDLFDPGEALTAGGFGLCKAFIQDIAAGGTDPFDAMASLWFQGLALGVLMERERWEAQR